MTTVIWRELSSVTERIDRLERELCLWVRGGNYREHLERQLTGARKRKAALIAELCDGARLNIGLDPAAARPHR